MLQQFTKAEAAEQCVAALASSAGINKAAANLSAGSLERTRLRCSSMSSRIVIAFRTHGIHRSCHNRLENGGELPKILGGLCASASGIRVVLMAGREKHESRQVGAAGTQRRTDDPHWQRFLPQQRHFVNNRNPPSPFPPSNVHPS